MHNDDKAAPLVLRALNYWRSRYLPTYAGLRLLVANSARSHEQSIAANMLVQLRAFPGSKYKDFVIFKNEDSTGRVHTRLCLASSPQLAIAEAKVLEELSRVPAFRPRECVYSYRWPSAKSGVSYSYFVDDYDQRLKRIRAAIQVTPNPRVVVTDINNFYPSVDQTSLRTKVRDALAGTHAEAHAAPLIDGLLARAKNGIPVGPAVSHALANLYLDELDVELHNLFGARYFRYVDDIAVVCQASEATATHARIAAAVRHTHLKLNDEKFDIVEGNTWRDHAPLLRAYDDELSTDHLGQMIRAALLQLPDEAEGLERALRSEGFPIPLDRYRSQVRNPRWRVALAARLRRRDRGLGFLARWIGSTSTPSASEIISTASKLKRRLWTDLENIRPTTGGATEKRWRLQRLRRTAAGLLFLSHREELPRLQQYLEETQDTRPVVLVIAALCEQKPWLLEGLPGAPTNSLATLWRRHRLPRIPVEADLAKFSGYESWLTLAAAGVAALTPAQRNTATSARNRVLLDAMLGYPADARTLNDHSYSDEIQSLTLGAQPAAMSDLLDTSTPDEDPATDLEILAHASG